MNIVLYAHFAGSMKHGMVYGHYYLAKEWVRKGHDVTIIAASFAHSRFEQPKLKRNGGFFCEEVIDGIRYIWVKTPKYNPSKKAGRAVNILVYSFLVTIFKLPLAKPDLVISSSHHALSIYAAKKLATKHNAKLVFEVRDIWPLTLIEVGGASPVHPFVKLLQVSEDYAYQVSDKVVSVLPHALSHMIGRGMSSDKFEYIPNGLDDSCLGDLGEPLPELHQRKLEELTANYGLLVGYAGNLGEANEIESLVKGLANCSRADIAIVIIGKGPNAEKIDSLITQLNLNGRVLRLPPVKKTQVKSFLSSVDLAFIGLRDEPLFRFGISPTKLNDYFLAKKPILYAINSKSEIVEESGAIVQCSAGDPVSIAVGLDKFASLSREKLEGMGELGFHWALKNRGYSLLAEQYLQKLS